jgi:hypothetical protein
MVQVSDQEVKGGKLMRWRVWCLTGLLTMNLTGCSMLGSKAAVWVDNGADDAVTVFADGHQVAHVDSMQQQAFETTAGVHEFTFKTDKGKRELASCKQELVKKRIYVLNPGAIWAYEVRSAKYVDPKEAHANFQSGYAAPAPQKLIGKPWLDATRYESVFGGLPSTISIKQSDAALDEGIRSSLTHGDPASLQVENDGSGPIDLLVNDKVLGTVGADQAGSFKQPAIKCTVAARRHGRVLWHEETSLSPGGHYTINIKKKWMVQMDG